MNHERQEAHLGRQRERAQDRVLQKPFPEGAVLIFQVDGEAAHNQDGHRLRRIVPQPARQLASDDRARRQTIERDHAAVRAHHESAGRAAFASSGALGEPAIKLQLAAVES